MRRAIAPAMRRKQRFLVSDLAERHGEADEIVVVVLHLAFHLVMGEAVADVVLGGGGNAEQGGYIEGAMARRNEPGSLAQLALRDRRSAYRARHSSSRSVLLRITMSAQFELVLEQFLDRIFMIEIGVGGALGGDGCLVIGEAALRRAPWHRRR